MRIAIVGSGALGLYYGSMLHRAGMDVHFLLRSDYNTLTRHGLHVFSVNGDFHLDSINGYRNSNDIGKVDLVLVGLKTYANDVFQEIISPLVGESTKILTLQNGLGNEELLAKLFGAEKILGGIAFLCATRGEPGTLHHLAEGRIAIGAFHSSQAEILENIAAIFKTAEIPCRIVPDLRKARWEKLVWNIPFNGMCALLKLPVDRLLSSPASRGLIINIMHEVIAAANAQHLSQQIPFTLADNMVLSSEKLIGYQPSMLIDLLAGRPLELDAIFTIPLYNAEKNNIPMVRVQTLQALLRTIAPG